MSIESIKSQILKILEDNRSSVFRVRCQQYCEGYFYDYGIFSFHVFEEKLPTKWYQRNKYKKKLNIYVHHNNQRFLLEEDGELFTGFKNLILQLNKTVAESKQKDIEIFQKRVEEREKDMREALDMARKALQIK